jgi:hypothetical protein
MVAAGALLLAPASAAADDYVDRYSTDRDELVWLERERPSAAAKLHEGEGLLAASRSSAELEKAAKLFGDASKEAPNVSLVARRLCQVLTALGKHDAAVSTCDYAFVQSRQFLNMRAVVGALMSGPGAAAPGDVSRALYLADRIVEILPEAPWGYAARCDIAIKLGDTEMLSRCSAELDRVAPGHYETERAHAALRKVRPRLGMLCGWLAIVALALGALVHAAVRAWRRRSAGRIAATIAAAGVLFAGVRDARASAQTNEEYAQERVPIAGHLSKYPIDPIDPESSVPTPAQRDKDPLEYGYFLMDLGDAAEKAKTEGDHVGAARFYIAMGKAVPDASVSFRKACEEYEAAKDFAKAKQFCADTLMRRDAILADYSHYARVVFAQPGDLPPNDVKDIDHVVDHLKKEEVSQTVAWDIECNLGVHLADVRRLTECTTPWAKVAGDEPKVIFFQWVLAMHQKDHRAAERLVAHAKRVASTPEQQAQVQQMAKATFDAMPLWRKGFRDWRVGAIAAVWVAGGLAFYLLRRPARQAPAVTRS